MGFKNEYLSNSRLKLYEQCPRAFFFQYVEPGERIRAPNSPAAFGSMVHAALENVFREFIGTSYEAPSPNKVFEAYRKAFEESGLVYTDIFREGRALVESYVASQRNDFSVMAVEEPFEIQLEEFKLKGFIDRVDQLAEDAIRIVDYKTNRSPFTRNELDNDLQFSVYGLAARELYPITEYGQLFYEFHMLRFDGLVQRTERSEDDLDLAAGYIVALGRQIERDERWEAKLNPNCAYCEHRHRCDAYREALQATRSSRPVFTESTASIEFLAKERERLHVLSKMAYARKAELDEQIRAKLEAEGSFEAAGHAYSLETAHTTEYADPKVVAQLFVASGLPKEEVFQNLFELNIRAVERYGRHLSEEAQNRLQAYMRKVPSSTRVHSKALVKKKVAAD